MVERMFDPGTLLSSSYRLPRGLRVRLRLPQPGDAPAIRALAPEGLEALEVARLIRFDPRRRLVICAAALIDGRERLTGIGAVDLEGAAARPSRVLASGEHAEDVEDLLRRALEGRARALADARAA